MKTWQKAVTVFHGGSQQVKAFHGKRVRASRILELQAYPADPAKPDAQISIAAGAIGFVGYPYPHGNELLLAFPKNPKQPVASIDELTRSKPFFVARVNEPTFKAWFEVEV